MLQRKREGRAKAGSLGPWLGGIFIFFIFNFVTTVCACMVG